MSQESSGGHPLQAGLIVLCLVGGGWYFFRHYNVDGLDGVSISPKHESRLGEMGDPFTFTSSTTIESPGSKRPGTGGFAGDPFASGESLTAARPADPDFEADPIISSPSDLHRRSPSGEFGRRTRYAPAHLRVAAWALDGFGPTKLASDLARKNLVRVVRQFDIIAVQQISSLQMDLVPRIVDAINESSLGGGAPLYDYVLGPPTGPEDRGEQMAILFNPDRVRVDRTQTYTVADPDNQLTYDPLVAWFRAAEPPVSEAWTFSLVNVRIDLSRAPREVALLGQLLKSVREDGRGEDDVVLAGLFQADDAYLLPVIAGPNVRASVTSTPTDIFGRHQTSNVLYDRELTAEAIGRGGVYDFLRVYNLSVAQAQAVSSYLPVYAEFTPLEGSALVHQAVAPATTPH
ncbi:exonuclease/endonuclease/phosphatase family protein [Rhodopirellula sallentina]|uniref:Deoxyribonuclease I (DNase I) n=1 Tax=Rhodopirellula sallentina SM41 TaxID=1263870 RepID=M5UCG4_9BACT|nr:deoxyribonuclease I precursor (DNase I) [Rhodopirellula sallentina]EMI53688.1 deoxyribonuclease I precursor (DNase I) [Rhodopirellula sallentina SM41]